MDSNINHEITIIIVLYEEEFSLIKKCLKNISNFSDGVVVGSSIVNIVKDNILNKKEVEKAVRTEFVNFVSLMGETTKPKKKTILPK